ncbi:neugrin isoform 1-T1 [Discoglossus pictus]
MMAAAVVTFLWRLRRVCSPQVSVLSSRGLRVTGRSKDPTYSEDELAVDLEGEAAALESALKKRRKAILFQRMKRQMEPPGPPERCLTWSAIEQIRYLKKEFPEEWTVSLLAEGFNVSTDVIIRVLRSTFSPNVKRKAKQDANVSKLLAQPPQGSSRDVMQPALSAKDTAQQLLTSGRNEKQLNGAHVQQLLQPPEKIQPEKAAALVLRSGDYVELRNKGSLQVSSEQNKPEIVSARSKRALSSADYSNADQLSSVEGEQKLDDEWDREVLSDGELEEISENGLKNTMKVVQKGREFFDTDGNFLYRI